MLRKHRLSQIGCRRVLAVFSVRFRARGPSSQNSSAPLPLSFFCFRSCSRTFAPSAPLSESERKYTYRHVHVHDDLGRSAFRFSTLFCWFAVVLCLVLHSNPFACVFERSSSTWLSVVVSCVDVLLSCCLFSVCCAACKSYFDPSFVAFILSSWCLPVVCFALVCLCCYSFSCYLFILFLLCSFISSCVRAVFPSVSLCLFSLSQSLSVSPFPPSRGAVGRGALELHS